MPSGHTWRYWSEGKLREEPRRLLFRAARSAGIDVIRGRERRLRLARSVPPPDQSGSWLGIDLRDALQKLSAEDRTLVLLQGAAGLSYEELAAIEGKTVAADRSRLHRARRELRVSLQPRGKAWRGALFALPTAAAVLIALALGRHVRANERG